MHRRLSRVFHSWHRRMIRAVMVSMKSDYGLPQIISWCCMTGRLRFRGLSNGLGPIAILATLKISWLIDWWGQECDRYTRNLVDVGNDRFNLMALCWGEGHGSSVHDHSDAHCFVKVLDGQLKETMYDWPASAPTQSADTGDAYAVPDQEPLRETAVNYYDKDGVTYINGLHAAFCLRPWTRLLNQGYLQKLSFLSINAQWQYLFLILVTNNCGSRLL